MNKKILILGASSDMGLALLDRLDLSSFTVGAHCYKGKKRIVNFIKNKNNNTHFKIIEKNLENKKAAHFLVDEFIKWSGGIDILVCNAAVNPFFGSSLDIPDDAFDKICTTLIYMYMTQHYYMSQHVAAHHIIV